MTLLSFQDCRRAGPSAGRLWMVGLLGILCWSPASVCLTAQTAAPASPSSQASTHAAAQPRPAKRAQRKTPRRKAETAAAAPVVPAAPPIPNWPVNDKAQPAKVSWDSHGLQVDAANSSLMQILADVSTATGTKVVGLSRDERIFGTYGPAPAREVLSQLLQGAGYNILMTGGAGDAAPLQLLLTPRKSGASAPYAASGPVAISEADEEPSAPPQEEPPQSAPPPNAINPGLGQPNAPRTPQQILQQMQQRQMQSPPEQGAPATQNQ